jgi:uncharacterized protein with GYD domain
MATFFMFGNYSSDAVEEISPKRTEEAANLIKGLGGSIKGMYALLGEHDLVLITELPGTQQAMQASVALSKMTGVCFATCPAVTVEEFDSFMT